ncbi:MAG TPA: GFA family protein [Labilithrix sp.]|jgi:hypothetical protein
MTERRGSCGCGKLTAVCEGEPVRVSICYCHACQQRTGSAFGVQARFPRERVQIAGEHRSWTRTGDSGGKATFHFCPTCAAIVFYELDGAPDFVALPVGVFADASFPEPHVAVYEARRAPWLVSPACVTEHWD